MKKINFVILLAFLTGTLLVACEKEERENTTIINGTSWRGYNTLSSTTFDDGFQVDTIIVFSINFNNDSTGDMLIDHRQMIYGMHRSLDTVFLGDFTYQFNGKKGELTCTVSNMGIEVDNSKLDLVFSADETTLFGGNRVILYRTTGSSY